MLYELYCLSLKSNGFGQEVDYLIVKDYCKKHGFDAIEEFKNIKIIVNWCSG